MTVEQWVGLSVGVCTLIGAVAMGVRHLVKYYLAELKPNGGSSIKDSITRLEQRVDDLFKLMAEK